jgi:hypothetical protein
MNGDVSDIQQHYNEDPVQEHERLSRHQLENAALGWTQLAREFVADIRGEGFSGYQTARDGWIFQEVVEAVRAGQGWTSIPQALA